MNELREFRPYVRHYDGLTVLFYKKDTIYLLDSTHETVIHRWWNVRNSYTSWKRLCRSYKYRKSLTYGQALGLAIRAGFGSASARHVPDVRKFNEFIPKEKK